MLVYVDRDSILEYYLVEIDKGSHLRRAVEVPDELVARHRKAQDEHREVQALLREIWNTSTG